VLPLQDERVRTQWLAFALTIKRGAPFTRLELVTFLEKNNIQTRPIFTGNILRQPGFQTIRRKVIKGSYPVANSIMEGGFLIGCHHGLTDQHISYVKEVFDTFFKKFSEVH
jgi:CDP-6-deoxy-D-xylo-4-hexulose-3-dehydrase